MLKNASILPFLAATDAEVAKEFYGEMLGLPLLAEEPYALAFGVHGAPLRVSIVQHVPSVPYTVLGWVVDNIAAVVDQLTERGIEFIRFDGIPQDDQGVAAFPDGTKVAWFQNPDGQMLSLTEHGGRS